jgi:hypothetical protein
MAFLVALLAITPLGYAHSRVGRVAQSARAQAPRVAIACADAQGNLPCVIKVRSAAARDAPRRASSARAASLPAPLAVA